MQFCPTGTPHAQDRDSTPARVLVVVSDRALRQLLVETLIRHNLEALEATTAVEAIRLVQVDRVEIAIVDAVLSGWHGLALCSMLRALTRTPGMRMVVIDGTPALTTAEQARAVGAAYLRKPFSPHELLQLTQNLRLKPFDAQ